MTAFLDTTVLVRHLTGEPRDQAVRATAFLSAADRLLLTDLVVAETVYVLESFYEAPREQVAEAIRSTLAFPVVVTLGPATLLRAVEVYENDRLEFAEAYLVACAEAAGADGVVSFDRNIDRVGTVRRIEP